MARPFTFEDQVHHADEAQCPACQEGYPQPCSCGGLIHAAGDAQGEESEVIAATRCDRCGRSEDELGEEVA